MRNYKKKSDRRPFTDALLNEAKQLMASGLSIRKAAAALGFSEAALRSRLKKGAGVNSLGRFKPVFTVVQENDLVTHCKELDKRYYGLTLKSLRYLLFTYSEKNNIKHPFSIEKKLAGRDFTRLFLKRNKLSLRQPRKTSIARMMGFNRVQLNHYFDLLEEVIQKYRFPANRIYNVDESGIQTVPNKFPKHIAPLGKKDVAKAVAAEQGQTVTAVCCMSPLGHYIPPFFIFARKRMNLLLIKDGPIGCDMAVTDSGYMNVPTFLKYLQHLKLHTNPSQENPLLLILDNHISHISLEAVLYAKENHIHMLSLPPHSSHRTQPLDRTFFKPLKSFYESVADGWSTSNPGQTLTIYHVAGLFAKAFAKAATVEIASEGFKATGIYPFNRAVFSDIDFLPSEVTDQELDPMFDKDDRVFIQFPEEGEQEQAAVLEPMPLTSSVNNLSALINEDVKSGATMPATPQTSSDEEEERQLDFNTSIFTPFNEDNVPENLTSPSDIIPFPKLKTARKRTRKSLKSTFLTSTPHKNQLLKISEEKEAKLEENERKAEQKKNKNKNKKFKVVKKLFQESSSDESIAFSTHDSDTSSVILNEVEPPEPAISFHTEDFILVKVHNETLSTYRLFAAKILKVEASDYEVIFLKRLPKTFRFQETEENAFVNKKDVVQKLFRLPSVKSARFVNTISFRNDLTQYVALL